MLQTLVRSFVPIHQVANGPRPRSCPRGRVRADITARSKQFDKQEHSMSERFDEVRISTE